MKRTLITKLFTDITDFNEEQVKAYSEFLKASFMPGGFKDISFEITQENEEDLFTRLLRGVRSEFLVNDKDGIRIESNGEVLNFNVNDAPAEKSDEQQRPRD